MRTTLSSVAILASSLLAREVLAAPYMQKREVVTDNVIVTEEITVTAEADGSYKTGLPVPIGTTTINGAPIVVESTSAAIPSSTSAAVSVASEPAATTTSGAIFIQKPSESETSSTAEPTTSTPAAVESTSTAAAVEPTTTPVAETTTTPVAVPTTFSTKTSSTAAVATASTSGKKRGLAYNDASLLSGFVSSDSKVDWCYNWASSTSGAPSSLEYVPLLWGMADEFTSVWNANADAAIAAGSTHLMAFNEPDLAAQSNLDVSDAVAGYMKYMQPFAGKAKLGAPAVTNGGAPMGLTYLGNFMSGIESAGGTVDFCAIHWYDSATNIAYFQNYMQEASTACNGKPIWLTEFGASGSADEQNTFLETVLPWMDEQSYIERYAYFMVTPGNLISSGTTLSTLGNTFATFT